MSASVWQPEPGWQPAPGGLGGAQVFWAERDRQPVVVKRLTAPQRGDPAALSDPSSYCYWRREADLALDGTLVGTPGVRAARTVSVDEDATGVTLVQERVAPAGNTGPLVARALGRLAAAPLEPRPWWATGQLADRLRASAARGGWPTLQRTTLADAADRLWERREHHLAVLDALPQVPGHGDPSLPNLPGRASDAAGDVVVGIDWSTFGRAAVGADAGYLALSLREDHDTVVEAYLAGLGDLGGAVDPADVRTAAAVVACYTAMTRTEWALGRVAATPGALAGKYRHPSVAPYIRQLQRLFPQLETLL